MVKHIDTIWRFDLLDMVDYREKSLWAYRYVSVVIDRFSEYGWEMRLKQVFTDLKKRISLMSFKIYSLKDFNWNKWWVGSYH